MKGSPLGNEPRGLFCVQRQTHLVRLDSSQRIGAIGSGLGSMGTTGEHDSMQLSERDKRFTESIVYGEAASISAAYRETRDSKASPKNARAEASRLWRSDKVQAYAGRLRDDLLARGRARAAADRERIVSSLWSEADHADKSSDRIAALRTLGQVSTIDLFGPDRVELSKVEGNAANSAEIAASIEQLLRETIQGAEVEPEDGIFEETQPPLIESGTANLSTHQSAQTIDIFEEKTPKGADILRLPSLKL